MKLIKLLLVIMAAAVITLALGGNALAFHAGGVAECSGCHTMHNSQDGQPFVTNPTSDYLLKFSDPSSTCLDCHAGYGQMTTDGSGYGSGGDFYWLTKTWTWTAHNSTHNSYGYEHGHSIVAADYMLPNSDPKLLTAPGGSFDSSNLSCASCHDPHGKGDAALLLRENETYANGTAVFPAGPVMITSGRRSSGSDAASDTNHSAYGSGMSAWCAACHTTFDDGLGSHMHPTNQTLGTTIANNYNMYITTGDMSGGTSVTGKYFELVPFETGTTDLSTLSKTSTDGPNAGSKVACISCHRAHATAFQDSGRWDFAESELVDSHPDGVTDGSSATDKLNSYYGRTISTDFSVDQRSFCNKCHAQDTG